MQKFVIDLQEAKIVITLMWRSSQEDDVITELLPLLSEGMQDTTEAETDSTRVKNEIINWKALSVLHPLPVY